MDWLRQRRWVLATMALTVAALCAAPLLLTAQFAALSNRPGIVLERALEASLYPANLATMLVANVMGSLESTADYWGPNHDTLPEVGATDRSFNYLFIGAATTIVLLWFGVAGGGMLRRGRRVLAGVLVVALLYMLGRYTPLYALAFQYVPGIDLFRRPVDGAFVFVAVLRSLPAICWRTMCAKAARGRRPGASPRSRPARSPSLPGRFCSRSGRSAAGARLCRC